ncbi:MAG: hypothetical protein JW724_03725 [Candidatus Altiarchaeota archaeon]|nr:hypothetical protein [Candidatus Altiarchaeota archaeon]
MDEHEVITRLQEFNKHAGELFSLSFVQKIKGSGYSIRWDTAEGFTTDLRGPDDEATKAFLSDIRRFFQKGDDTLKIHKLIPLYKSSFVCDSERKIFNRVLSDLEKFNQKKTPFSIKGEKLTNKRVFEVFAFGRFSHRSEGTKEVHDSWEKITPIYVGLRNEFNMILYNYLIFINNIVYANKETLKKLTSKIN